MNTAPYGSWKSPIASDLIVSSSIRLGSIALDDGKVYWNEGRPTEGGRNVIVGYSDRGYIDITPKHMNVRSQVHEYGGGEYLLEDGRLYFSNFSDRGIYRQVGDNAPQRLTPENNCRYRELLPNLLAPSLDSSSYYNIHQDVFCSYRDVT